MSQRLISASTRNTLLAGMMNRFATTGNMATFLLIVLIFRRLANNKRSGLFWMWLRNKFEFIISTKTDPIRKTTSIEQENTLFHNNIADRIRALPSVQTFRERCRMAQQAGQADNFTETSPRTRYLKLISEQQAENHFTIKTLYGNDRLSVPIMFRIRLPSDLSHTDPGIPDIPDIPIGNNNADTHADADGNYTHIIYTYLGSKLCSHPNIIHGGMLATLMDEALGIQALYGKTGFTAQLTIQYRRPVTSDQVVRVRTWSESIDGRKFWVCGVLEAIENVDQADTDGSIFGKGQTLVEARALFIEPRQQIPKTE